MTLCGSVQHHIFMHFFLRSVVSASSSSRSRENYLKFKGFFFVLRLLLNKKEKKKTFIFVIVHKSLIFAWLRHRIVAPLPDIDGIYTQTHNSDSLEELRL